MGEFEFMVILFENWGFMDSWWVRFVVLILF